MIKNPFKYFQLFFGLLLLLACNTNKEANGTKTENCTTIGTVKDFTGLDGCTLLIVLENGDKLLPAKINDEAFELRDKQKIRFDYREMEDMMSICMAEKASIEITCIELIEGRPLPAECFDTEEPLEVPWMREVINTKKPSSVFKYAYRTDGWAYLFMIRDKQVLYDCQGTLLCEQTGLGTDQCLDKFVPNSTGKEIYSM